MIEPALPTNEKARLQVLYEHHLLDSLPEQDYDDITRIATEVTGTPMSTITLVDRDRQWFKSEQGFGANGSTRRDGFCAHTILQPNCPMIVPDTRLDERFHDNPFVVEPPKLIFYAGVPVTSKEGFALGTLCVLDQRPRELTAPQLRTLQSLANQVGRLFELRRNVLRLEADGRKLETLNEQLTKFSYILSHDVKSPLNSIGMLLEALQEDQQDKLDEGGKEHIEMMVECVSDLKNFVENVVDYFQTTTHKDHEKTDIYVHDMFRNISQRQAEPKGAIMSWPDDLPNIYAFKLPLEQILSNLISNAIKYNDKETPIIHIGYREDPSHYHFQITDNGPGIPKAYQEKVFKMFETMGQPDRFQNKGTGLGLSIVKKFVEDAGGEINLTSIAGEGSTFAFSLKK